MKYFLTLTILVIYINNCMPDNVEPRVTIDLGRNTIDSEESVLLDDDSSSASDSVSREGRLLGNVHTGVNIYFNGNEILHWIGNTVLRLLTGWFGNLFGNGPPIRNCGHPDNCPVHACRFDPAVIHGYCCGCAHPTDRVQVVCPPDLHCPLYGAGLCHDYNFMMDCCC